MTPFKRALLAWGALMGLFLLGVIAFAAYGDWAVRRVEAKRLVARSRDFVSNHRLDEAAQQLQQAVDVKPEQFEARRLLVSTLLQSGRAAEAVAQADAALERAPEQDRLQALLLVGRANLEAGYWAAAGAAYTKAVEAAPNSAEAHYGLARFARLAGSFHRTAMESAKAAELGTSGSTPEYIADVERRQREITAVKAEGSRAGASYRLGCLLMDAGRWTDAKTTLERAVNEANVPADAFFRLGMIAEAAGDCANAIEQYRRAVEAAPDHREAWAGLERCGKA